MKRILFGLRMLWSATEAAIEIIHEFGWRALFSFQDSSTLTDKDWIMLLAAVDAEGKA